jgi:hypothetical protein
MQGNAATPPFRSDSEARVEIALPPATWAPLIPAAKSRGYGRTVAYALAREGLVNTAKVGGKVMVNIASLDSLPERMAALRKAQDAANGDN